MQYAYTRLLNYKNAKDLKLNLILKDSINFSCIQIDHVCILITDFRVIRMALKHDNLRFQ